MEPAAGVHNRDCLSDAPQPFDRSGDLLSEQVDFLRIGENFAGIAAAGVGNAHQPVGSQDARSAAPTSLPAALPFSINCRSR